MMSTEYQYTDRELDESASKPNLSAIHSDVTEDSQISGCCGVSKTLNYVSFIESEDQNGDPEGKGTVKAIWSDAICNDCKTAFDTIIDNRAPGV